MFFKLSDVEYKITSSSVILTNKNDSLYMSIRIVAKTEEKIDYEIREVELYIDSFNTNVKNNEELENQKFIWSASTNSREESAGVLNIVEYEDVTNGVIEIKKIENNNITIHWSGNGNVFWNEKFGKDVPFDVEICCEL